MTKQHLKALNTPRTWNVARKATTFVTRPHPGAHPLQFGISLNHVIKHELQLAHTTKEVKLILTKRECLVNTRPAVDIHHIVGLFDVVSFPLLKKYYRVVLNNRGKLVLIEIPEKESTVRISKVINKTLMKKGLLQVNLFDSRNITLDTKTTIKTGTTLLIELPTQKILKEFAFKEGCTILLIGGKHIGSLGTLEQITDQGVVFKSTTDGKSYQTLLKYVFVVGDKSPEITVQ
ncbi:MAG: 30S ribosomal protein S4e [Candidatus Woesearchaeota archaeon]